MPDSPVVLIYDASGQPVSTAYAPVTGRPGQAFYSASGVTAQGGIVALGSDYGSSPKAQVPKVDASGSVYVTPSDAVQAGSAVANTASVIGNVMLGMQALTPTPLAVDAQGNLLCAPTVQPTFSVYAQGVQMGSGKSLLSLVNKSASSIVRIVSVHAQNTATSPGVLSSYFIMAQEAHFITGATGGTACTPVAMDTADSLPSGIACYTAATVSGEVNPAVRRWITSNYALAPGATAAEDTTGDQQGRDPWMQRFDSSAKPITIRPGYGLHVKCATTSNDLSKGYQDVTMVFTVASA